MMTDAVPVRYDTPVITTALVSADDGTFSVCRVRSLGWSCECGESGCVHEKAARQITGR
jgi:hypothetical protein